MEKRDRPRRDSMDGEPLGKKNAKASQNKDEEKISCWGAVLVKKRKKKGI